jgi:hypothetical protein
MQAKEAIREGTKAMKNSEDEAGSDSESSEQNCINCLETFSNSTASDGWVECTLYGHWAHDVCAGVKEEDYDEYTCDLCRNIKQK